MAIQDISNLAISSSFQNILQISGSVIGTATGTQIDDLSITASHATTAISASHAIIADSALSANTSISASHAIQADSALSADTVISASHAVNADIAISSSYALSSSRAENAGIVGLFNESIADGLTFQVLRTDGAGNLNFNFADRTQIEVRATEAIAKGDPLYVTGFNVGENRVTVEKADAGDSNKMPVFGLAYEAVPINTNTQMVSIGTLDDIDTQVTLDFQVGDTIYVAVGGGLTNVRPTGTNLIQNVGVVGRRNQTNGEILVSAIGRSNDLPNIAEGNLWVGNLNGVPQAVATSSLSVATASLALGVDTNATLNVASISASSAVFTSASIGYLESITGSAKIIGDAFIVVNNNTPTERYAGLSVYDSGSLNNTSSFAYDGQTDDWFFEKDVTGSAHFGVALFGPEYATKGAPAYLTENRIPKGVGNHHLEDSNITDDGSKIILGSNAEITGSLAVTGTITGNVTFATSASHALIADNAVSSSHAVQADSALTAATATSASYAVSASHADNVPDGIITNSTDTYTTPKVNNVITLTDAEYTAIVTPDANTFYIVI
jgi:hypothetical protein